jgi:hypothetical protein
MTTSICRDTVTRAELAVLTENTTVYVPGVDVSMPQYASPTCNSSSQQSEHVLAAQPALTAEQPTHIGVCLNCGVAALCCNGLVLTCTASGKPGHSQGEAEQVSKAKLRQG